MLTREATTPAPLGLDDLPDDLQELVRARDRGLAETTEIGPVADAPDGKHTYRLRFEDGEILKGRTCHSTRRAARYTRVATLVDPERFPRIVGRFGKAVLEEWATGRSLGAREWTTERLRDCGEILGKLHADHGRPPPRWRRPELEIERLRARIGALVDAGALSPVEAERLGEAAEAALPDRIEWGLIHGDFCADNVVLRPSGALAVIDNESMDLGAVDGDLARTFTRWELTSEQRRAFGSGYERHRDMGGFVESYPYWTIRSLVGSAAFWLRVDGGERHLAELRASLRSVGRDEGDREARP